MTDEEYLEKAGIKDSEAQGAPANTVEAPQAENVSAPTPPSASGAPAPSASGQAPVAKTAAQKAVEMFELNGQKFPVNTKFKFPHGGKLLEVPYENLVNKYRLAEHLEDKFKKFGDEQKSFQQMKQAADEAMAFKQKYGALQEWSEKNPNDWKTIWDLFQNREQHLLAARTQGQMPMGTAGSSMNQTLQNQPNLQPILQKLQETESKLQKYDQLAEQYNRQQTEVQMQRDTDFIKTEISDFQKDFPEVNLNERDPDGVALWAKIIQWGLDNRYTDFKPAAQMFLRQRLDDVIASRARSEALKSSKMNVANGVIKRSSTPFQSTNGKEINTPRDIRKLSYNQIAELSKEQVRNLG